MFIHAYLFTFAGFVTNAMIQLCNAVEYLHHHDITHGVVHPCNMIMTSLNGQRVVLTDFSQARRAGVNDTVSSIFTEFLGESIGQPNVVEESNCWKAMKLK